MAAAASPIPVTAPSRKAIARGWCGVPRSYLLRAHKELTYVEYVVLGLILDSTVGWQQEWAAIDVEAMARAANVTTGAIHKALYSLQFRGDYIQTKRFGSDRVARIADLEPRPKQDPEVAYGRCGVCGEVAELELDPGGWVPVPHTFFWYLPKACTYAEFRVACVIADATLGWQREWAPLSIAQFSQVLGITDRAVREALEALESRGVVDRRDRAGRVLARRDQTSDVCEFSIRTDAFTGLEARQARTVDRANREEKAKAPAKESLQPDEVEEPGEELENTTHAVSHRAMARCRSCGQMSFCQIFDQFRPGGGGEQPAPRPPGRSRDRAGASGPAPPVPKEGGAARSSPGFPSERGSLPEDPRSVAVGAVLEQWAASFGALPDLKAVRAVRDALGDTPESLFLERCRRRSDYLSQASGYMAFVPLARDASQAWARLRARSTSAGSPSSSAEDPMRELRQRLADPHLAPEDREFILREFPEVACE